MIAAPDGLVLILQHRWPQKRKDCRWACRKWPCQCPRTTESRSSHFHKYGNWLHERRDSARRV